MTQRFGFLLLPGFALLELAGASDALGAANVMLGEQAHDALLFSLDGQPVRSQHGLLMGVHGALAQARGLHALLIVASTLPEPGSASLAALAQALPGTCSPGAWLGGIGSGAGWLAGTGLLDGHRCAVRWEHVSDLAERHPAVVVSTHLFEMDRQRLSCAGGSASLDMLIHWLGQRHGSRLAQRLGGHFGLERLRTGQERQGGSQPQQAVASSKLAEALALMEANLAEPLATEDIAQLVGVSRRQLERLFKQHLGELPSRWYLALRLARARRLLQQTSQSILQAGLACGFASGPHFSRAYRAQFGHTPREERASRAAAWRAAPANDGEGFAAPALQAPSASLPAAPTPTDQD
ncbi:GlxA family transcriptional regulator [Ideonella sp.]|uniref:GlxA family transcriptional regulator n=1 Tax=Ideonella sp. TaxID=1929293 RepID=UPI003BB4E039